MLGRVKPVLMELVALNRRCCSSTGASAVWAPIARWRTLFLALSRATLTPAATAESAGEAAL
jgi:hypothetical protein